MPWDDKKSTMFDYYNKYLVPFGEVLTDMEHAGFYVDLNHIENIKKQAIIDRDKAKEEFIQWAVSLRPEAIHMNVSSSAQLQQFLFAPFFLF